MNNSRNFFGLLIIILIILLIVLGFLIYQKETNPAFLVELRKQIRPPEWEIYRNEENRFKFSYPQEYSLRVALPATSLFFLEKEINGEKKNWFEINVVTINTSIIEELLGRCDADGVKTSISCDKVISQSQFEKNNVTFHEIYLNEVTMTGSKKSEKTKGPIFVADLSENKAVFFQQIPHSNEDLAMLRQIISSFKLID